MKRGLLILAALVPSVALAQTINRPQKLDASAAASAFAVKVPDEGSPFFSVREAAKTYATQENQEQRAQNEVAIYPRVKNSPDSANAIFGRFFTEMFSSIKFKALNSEPFTTKLTVEPIEFSLQERRDLETVYSVRNNTGKMVRLIFPTSQRIEILTQDSNGTVVDKWSDDRAFKPQEGIVILNPKERIEYVEPVPTRDMKPGVSYSIQTDLVGYPDYTTTKVVTPTP